MYTVYSPKHWLHDTSHLTVNGQAFITEEIPERVEVILAAVQQAALGALAPPHDYGREPLLAVHSVEYIHFLEHIAGRGRAFYGDDRPLLPETFCSRAPQHKTAHPIGELGYYCFGTYTPILRGTWEAAYWSAQCALTAALHARDNRETTFALCRPPGHHAGSALYGGFCYLNNAAIAAQALGLRTSHP
jgi:acetoin utilization deacetylase AcuC-like enzyme